MELCESPGSICGEKQDQRFKSVTCHQMVSDENILTGNVSCFSARRGCLGW